MLTRMISFVVHYQNKNTFFQDFFSFHSVIFNETYEG